MTVDRVKAVHPENDSATQHANGPCLEENIGVAAIELTPYHLREIEWAAPKIKVEGARHPDQLEKLTGR